MAEGSGISAGDVLALTRNNGAMDWSWIIGLLVIAGIFGGNWGFGGNRAGVTEEYIANQFTQRDTFNLNTAVLEGNNALTRDILENRNANAVASCGISKEVMQNRYDSALGLAGLQKDVLVGNQVMQAQMADCCCGIKSAILEDGQKTRDLINSINYANALEKINDLKSQLSDKNTVESILNAQGRWHAYPSCSCGYNSCGYSNLA